MYYFKLIAAVDLEKLGMPAANSSIRRVLLVDDYPILRIALRHVIESKRDLAVCAEADTARRMNPHSGLWLSRRELHHDTNGKT